MSAPAEGAARVLGPSDAEAALDLLVRAFERDPLCEYMLLGVRDRARALRTNMSVCLDFFLPRGHVLGLGEPVLAVAAILTRGLHATRWQSLGSHARLLLAFGLAGHARLSRLNTDFTARRPRTMHVYVGNMAVRPEHQRRGLGRALVAGVAAHARAIRGELVYLDTSSPGNVAFYGKCGFAVQSEWTPDAGRAPRTWGMSLAVSERDGAAASSDRSS